MSLEASGPTKWFLRTSPESVHGELTMDVLCQWAEQGRILADNELSDDGESWSPASDLPELKMDWLVTLKSGASHGPLNLLSIPSLYRRGVIDDEAVLENKNNHQKVLAAALLRGLSSAPAEAPEDVPSTEAPTGVTLLRNDEVQSATASSPQTDAPEGPPSVKASSALSATTLRKPSPPRPEPAAARVSPLLKNHPAPALDETPPVSEPEAQAEGAVALRQQVDQLSRENETLKSQVNSTRQHAHDENEARRNQKSEIHVLREQNHVAKAHVESAEKAHAEQAQALAAALADAASLRATIKQFETVAKSTPASVPVSESVLVDITNALDALHAKHLEDVAEIKSKLQDSSENALSADAIVASLVSDADALIALVNSVAELQHDAQKFNAMNRKEREGTHQMTKTKREDSKSDLKVESTLRQRIALLESALAEYKNKETKTGSAKAAPSVSKREHDEIKAQLEKAEATAKERVTAVRSERDAVIATLTKENEKLVKSATAAKKTPAPKAAPKVTKTDTKKLEALKAEHEAALQDTQTRHEAAVAELKAALDAATSKAAETDTKKLDVLKAKHEAAMQDTKNRQEAVVAELTAALDAATTETGAGDSPSPSVSVVELKKQNISLSQRDADQSQSIADLKTQVAGLYGEMATRQKEALERFKQRESQLKTEMSSLAAGAPVDASRTEAVKDRNDTKALRDEIAQLRKAKATAEQDALAKVQDASKVQQDSLKKAHSEIAQLKSLATELETSKQAEALLKSQLAEVQSQKAKQSAAEKDEKKQSAQLEDAQKAWQKREASMVAELDAMKKSLAEKDAASAKALEGAKSNADKVREEAYARLKDEAGDDRSKALEADLKVLRAENEALRGKTAAPKAKMAKSGKSTPVSMTTWFLRLDNGKVFGPVSLTELIEWAADCRIGPDHQVSPDGKDWMRAADVEGLRMLWQVKLGDGQEFGPLNLFAVGQLIQDGVVGNEAAVTNVKTGEKNSFNTLIAQEIRVLLEREKELVDAIQAKTPEPAKGVRRQKKKS